MSVDIDHTCWSCGKRFDRASLPRGDTVPPQQGDISLCMGCGEWGLFDKHWKGGLRQPTHDEYVEIVADEDCTNARAAWLRVKQETERERRKAGLAVLWPPGRKQESDR